MDIRVLFRLVIWYLIHRLNIQVVHMIAVEEQETSGTVFLIGFPFFSSFRSQYETLRLTIFTVENRDTEVKLCTPGLDGYSQNGIIIQGSTFKSHTVDISMRVEGVNKTMKTLLIVSDDPIIVYSWEFGGNSVETLIAFPLQTFGNTYYILTCSLQDSMSELLLIGIYDGTNITMELPDNLVDKVTWSGTLLDNNRTIIDNLNLFETIQVQARGDLSGTYVEASKAIGVIVANERTKLVSNGYQDNVFEMIPSVEKWGTHFICVGTPQTRRTDIVKVLSSEPHTNVRVDGSVDNDFTMTKSGDIFSIDLPIGGSVEIAADKPVLVAQYYTQDPAMAIVPPVEQWEENYTIAIPYNNSFENYLIVVVRGPDVSKITLDGMPLNASFEHIYSDFWKAIVRVFQGKYVLSNEREATFGVLIFGYISIQSYFIPAGMKHRNISAHAIGNQINNGQQAFLDLNRYCLPIDYEFWIRGGCDEPETTVEDTTLLYSTKEYSTVDAETCCACYNVINITDESIQQKLEELKKTLLIDKKSTKIYQRSLISQPDSRTSAMTTGNIFGTCILSLVAVLVILLDLSYLLCHNRNK